MRTFHGIDDLKASVGEEIGTSDWICVDQPMIDAFADVTGDHQWIHVDRQRAKDTPFGSTIAHGLLTLSLAPRLMTALFTVQDVGFMLNYGYAKVRFPAPVKVDSRLRMTAALTAAEDVPGGVQITITQTLEVEDERKPACVSEALVRVYAAG